MNEKFSNSSHFTHQHNRRRILSRREAYPTLLMMLRRKPTRIPISQLDICELNKLEDQALEEERKKFMRKQCDQGKISSVGGKLEPMKCKYSIKPPPTLQRIGFLTNAPPPLHLPYIDSF